MLAGSQRPSECPRAVDYLSERDFSGRASHRAPSHRHRASRDPNLSRRRQRSQKRRSKESLKPPKTESFAAYSNLHVPQYNCGRSAGNGQNIAIYDAGPRRPSNPLFIMAVSVDTSPLRCRLSLGRTPLTHRSRNSSRSFIILLNSMASRLRRPTWCGISKSPSPPCIKWSYHWNRREIEWLESGLLHASFLFKITKVWAGHPTWTCHETVRHELAQEGFDNLKPLKARVILRKPLGQDPKSPTVEAVISPVRSKIEIDFTPI
jgi:hypothetical protein